MPTQTEKPKTGGQIFLELALAFKAIKQTPKTGENHKRNFEAKQAKRGTMFILETKGTHRTYLNRKLDRLAGKAKYWFEKKENNA